MKKIIQLFDRLNKSPSNFLYMVVNSFDIIFAITAVLANLVISAIYVFSRKNAMNTVNKLGIAFLSLGIPMIVVLIGYIVIGYKWWAYLILSYIVCFFIVQLLLDFILKIEFREKPTHHIPYIIFFYIFQIGLIVLSFNINYICGYIVSSSFWILLAALIYLYIGKRKDKKLKNKNP